jgi:hypothetical protein
MGEGELRGAVEAWIGGDRPVILLSTGAWGAATRVGQTVRLLAGAGYRPVVLCGQDERLRDRAPAPPSWARSTTCRGCWRRPTC